MNVNNNIFNNFRKNCKNIFEMIVHSLENVNIPTVWRDWDVDKGTHKDQKRRRTKVLLEMVLIMVVRSVFHALMILPVILTGYQSVDNNKHILIQDFLKAGNVWSRHELLENTVGVLPEEQISFDNMTTLFYIAVVLVPILSVTEILLYCLYQRKVDI